MTAAALGLGANLGDARGALADAVHALAAEPAVRVSAVSGLWRTAPVGGPEQPDYCNAVVVIETTLTPDALLALAQRLEEAAGRVRDVRWGPRTLDVDLLDVEGVTRDEADLTLPHPRAHQRGFVVAPWAQAAPEWMLTPSGELGAPVATWAEHVLAAQPEGSILLIDEGQWWR